MNDVNPWIPLEEILPEPRCIVLFWRRRKEGRLVLPFVQEIMPGYIDEKGAIHGQFFCFDPSAEYISYNFHPPSHWMPLPPAPPGERYAREVA